MINPSDLRLGNFVNFGGKLVKITAIREETLEGIAKDGAKLSSSPSLAQPVPITEAMLC